MHKESKFRHQVGLIAAAILVMVGCSSATSDTPVGSALPPTSAAIAAPTPASETVSGAGDTDQAEDPAPVDPAPVAVAYQQPTAADIPSSVPGDLEPSLGSVSQDLPLVYELGCHVDTDVVEAKSCQFGDPTGPTVVLVGDSHASQWAPALVEVAVGEAWNLHTMAKSACPFADTTFRRPPYVEPFSLYEECLEWGANAVAKAIEVEADLVLVTWSVANVPYSGEGFGEWIDVEQGLVRNIEQLAAAGIDVVLLQDTPKAHEHIPECLAIKNDIDACTFDVADPTTQEPYGLFARVAEASPNVTLIDLTNHLCIDGRCPPVIGRTLVWRDNNHLSTVFAERLSSPLRDQLAPLLAG